MALRSLTNLLFHFSTNRPACNHYFGLRVEVLRFGRKLRFWRNARFDTPCSVFSPDFGESRGLVSRFLPTSAIWFPELEKTPGREKRARLSRVPNLKFRPTVGTKFEVSPRKSTKPRDFASISLDRGTKPPISPASRPRRCTRSPRSCGELTKAYFMAREIWRTISYLTLTQI